MALTVRRLRSRHQDGTVHATIPVLTPCRRACGLRSRFRHLTSCSNNVSSAHDTRIDREIVTAAGSGGQRKAVLPATRSARRGLHVSPSLNDPAKIPSSNLVCASRVTASQSGVEGFFAEILAKIRSPVGAACGSQPRPSHNATASAPSRSAPHAVRSRLPETADHASSRTVEFAGPGKISSQIAQAR